jgi:hypothetical protein
LIFPLGDRGLLNYNIDTSFMSRTTGNQWSTKRRVQTITINLNHISHSIVKVFLRSNLYYVRSKRHFTYLDFKSDLPSYRSTLDLKNLSVKVFISTLSLLGLKTWISAKLNHMKIQRVVIHWFLVLLMYNWIHDSIS